MAAPARWAGRACVIEAETGAMARQVGAGDDIGIPCVCIKSSDFDAHLDKSDAIVTLRM